MNRRTSSVLTTVSRAAFIVIAAATLGSGWAIPLRASDELARAKDLYGAASYDDALSALDSLPAAKTSAEAIDVLQYRVFCLVALDRKEDAKQAMAALITASPQHHISEQDASPRVRAMFTEVRRSLYPSLVQRAYADAKAAFDRKDATAAAQFDHVLAMLKDPDVAADPGLADLATVASGFRDLSQAVVSAPPASPAAVAVTAKPAVKAPPNVSMVPAVAISQSFPPLQIREERQWDGEVEVLIDDKGRVTSARMLKSIHPLYDAQLLRAARSWTYKPALKNGVPAQMVKVVAIHLDSRPACSTQRVKRDCRPDPE